MVRELYFCDNCKKQVDRIVHQKLYLKYWFAEGLMNKTDIDLCEKCLNEIADKLAEIPWINEMVSEH